MVWRRWCERDGETCGCGNGVASTFIACESPPLRDWTCIMHHVNHPTPPHRPRLIVWRPFPPRGGVAGAGAVEPDRRCRLSGPLPWPGPVVVPGIYGNQGKTGIWAKVLLGGVVELASSPSEKWLALAACSFCYNPTFHIPYTNQQTNKHHPINHHHHHVSIISPYLPPPCHLSPYRLSPSSQAFIYFIHHLSSTRSRSLGSHPHLLQRR